MSAALDLEAGPSTALTVVSAKAISTIVAADKDDILGAYAAKVRAFKPDISTVRGRDEIRSLAAEGRRVKASLLRLAGGLKENALKTQRAINAEERIVEERMDALVENIRAPLTEYENVEKARVAGHEEALAQLQEAPGFYSNVQNTSADLRMRLDWLNNQPARDWQEFAQRAVDTIDEEVHLCRRALADAVKREAEAAELARLRAEAEERARQDAARLQAEREARIAAEAADRARRDAEAKAERERQETLRAAAEARAKVEREAQAARDRAEEAERRRVAEAAAAQAREEAAARKVEADRVAAEHRAERDREAAVAAERKRQADDAARIEREAEAVRAADQRRAANLAHQIKVNRAAVTALLLCNITEEQAKAVVVAIAKGQVPAVGISY